MAENNTTVSYDFTSASISLYFCQKPPYLTWDLTNTTLPWILVGVIFTAAPVTTVLNILVVVALNKSRELQKPSNILLCSMAVTDLITGAITMPMSAIVDVLMLTRVSVEHVCTFDSLVNKLLLFTMSNISLYHLTAIAWERYMAIKCWKDYRNKVTKHLLQNLGAIAWLLPILKLVPTVAMIIVGVDRTVLGLWLALGIILVMASLFATVYFYIMLFLGLRKRKQNQTSQVTIMMKAKLESKVAKTTGLLTAGLLISFVPSIVITTSGTFLPAFSMNSAFRLSEVFVQLNSVLTPVLYFYRDRRFRNAVKELLGMKTTKNIQQSVEATQSSKKNELNDKASIQLSAHNGKTTRSILTTSASPDAAGKVDQGLKATLGRSISDPTLYKCSRDSFVPCGSPPYEPSSHLTTIAADRNESSKKRKWRNSKGKVHPLATHAKNAISARRSVDLTSIKSRSEFCDNKANVNIFHSFRRSKKTNKTNSDASYSQIQRYLSLDVTYSSKGGFMKKKPNIYKTM